MKATAMFIVITAMVYMPIVAPAWLVLIVGMPIGIVLLYLLWRELA
jgi:hypothetical protein